MPARGREASEAATAAGGNVGSGDAAPDGDGMSERGGDAQVGGGLPAKRDKQQIVAKTVAKTEKQQIVALAPGGGGGGAGGSAWAPIRSDSIGPHTGVDGGDDDNSSGSSSRPPAPAAVTETSAAGSEQGGCVPGTAVRPMTDGQGLGMRVARRAGTSCEVCCRERREIRQATSALEQGQAERAAAS